MTREDSTQRRLRAGIVGGGRGAFIGAVHRIAAELDGQGLVVAGAMSADPGPARDSAAAWFLDRSYDSFEEMARAEAARPDGIDFVIVATPNHLHYPVAKAFIGAGIHVVCDKPLALTVSEGESIVALLGKSRVLFGVTHTYAGYPMVRQARDMIRAGELGTIRKVLVEYNQDWLMEPLERQGNKQAQWRQDPARAGISSCVADIGTHAENLLEFVSGLKITSLCADLSSFVAGRTLDDDANILLRLEGGAKGMLVCSQVACGEENALSLRVYGSGGGLEWRHDEANTLIHKPPRAPWRRLRTGATYLGAAARGASRTPPGHPEGYLEAFATLYKDFIADVRRVEGGQPPFGGYASAADGVRGLRFIERAVESSRLGGQWLAL
jgi:predicted dehydrogenase